MTETTKEEIVAFIPARSGSKGLVNKNIANLHGLPVIAYSVLAAKKCIQITDVFLSSDSNEYLDIAEKYGASIHKRSDANSTSNASMLDVIKEFDEYYLSLKGGSPVYLIMYPTYPLRSSSHLTKIIEYYRKNSNSSTHGLIGIKPMKDNPYMQVDINGSKGITPVLNPDVNSFYRRQDYPEAWTISHWACLVSSKYINSINNQLYSEKTIPYIIDNDLVVDIDNKIDLEYAEFLMGLDPSKQLTL
jgi:CMP-N,N'-diacetyllegionaminic acid synthase